jgi:hypothetical protein
VQPYPQPQYPQPGPGPQYGPPPPQYQPGQPAPQYAPPQPAQAAPQPGTGRWAAPEAAPDGDRVTATSLDNHLLIVVAVSSHPAFFEGKPAKFDANHNQIEAEKPPSDAIKVNVVDLDDRDPYGAPGKTYIGVMWGGKVLAKGLARQIGVPVLARMGKGQARGANAAPAILVDMSGDPSSCQRADEFVNRRPHWQDEPSTLPAATPPPAPQPAYPPQPYPQGQPAPYGQQQPGYPPQGMPPQYGQPAFPPQPAYAPQGYGQPAPAGYAPGMAAGPGSPEAQAAYANMAAQQYPQQYQQ